ncbi:hypothetical protein AB5I41_07610 [Sphingomonas sp. MMS24-JH45]
MPPIVAFAPGSMAKDQARIAQMLVELLAAAAGLYGAVEILGIDRQDRVHLA